MVVAVDVVRLISALLWPGAGLSDLLVDVTNGFTSEPDAARHVDEISSVTAKVTEAATSFHHVDESRYDAGGRRSITRPRSASRRSGSARWLGRRRGGKLAF
jgi:hypothetical protein